MNPTDLTQINNAVAVAIQIHVNGKIDKIAQHLVRQDERQEALRTDFQNHVNRIEPVIAQFEERRGFWKTLSGTSKGIGIVAGTIVALGIISTFLMKLK